VAPCLANILSIDEVSQFISIKFLKANKLKWNLKIPPTLFS
jgi:hypothetical protein